MEEVSILIQGGLQKEVSRTSMSASALTISRAENRRLKKLLKEKNASINGMQTIINQQAATIKDLKARLSKNSKNSGKPPSSDGLKKPDPKSQRRKSDKPSGGQEGHTGHSLKPKENPDFIENHVPNNCENCSFPLDSLLLSDHYEARQEFDVPEAKQEVTEHRAYTSRCPHCGHHNKAEFPANITHPVQYGSHLKALAVYYNQEQLIPYGRLKNLLKNVHDVSLSEGTLYNINLSCYEKLASMESTIKEGLINSPVVHFDESGLRVKKKLHWLHVASTNNLTYYAVHEKRGSQAMDEIDILPQYQGTAVHDHWAAYFKYDCAHSLCNAHHLRELTYHEENYDQLWCKKMREHLLNIHQEVALAKEAGKEFLPNERCLAHQKTYDNILSDGLRNIPKMPNQAKKRGRKKQHPSKNLWNRLSNESLETLSFMSDFSIPFTNNLGERDIRMNKVKQKVSGCFRSQLGAKIFCRTRGYISTMKKQGNNTLDAMVELFNGNPLIPFADPEPIDSS